MDWLCGLAAETQVETPDGPMEIRKVAGKEIPVFSRDANGRVRFRMMRQVRCMGASEPVLRVSLENGWSFRAVPRQGVFLAEGTIVTLAELAPGVLLYPAFHYPKGYRFRTDGGEERESAHGWRVESIEAGGDAEVFSLHVPPERCFFLSAGVLCCSE
jgi:hypothetical protein